MNPQFVPPRDPRGIPPSKPGRKLGPIAPQVGSAHRAWLELLRERFLASGLTITDLSERCGWSKSKISELLRGAGLYPRWEFTHSLLHVLGIPTWPMRRLWAAAAVEAHKKPDWIKGCIQGVTLSTGPAVPPVDHRVFAEMHKASYTAYARAFLRDGQADHVVEEVFQLLWLRWSQVPESSDVEKFAWQVLRASVMARTPHFDGYPELAAAAFDTVALQQAPDAERYAQLEESMALFNALSRLPDFQLDVTVLMHLRGMKDTDVADVLGVPIASVHSADRHAQRYLDEILSPRRPTGGTPQ